MLGSTTELAEGGQRASLFLTRVHSLGADAGRTETGREGIRREKMPLMKFFPPFSSDLAFDTVAVDEEEFCRNANFESSEFLSFLFFCELFYIVSLHLMVRQRAAPSRPRRAGLSVS